LAYRKDPVRARHTFLLEKQTLLPLLKCGKWNIKQCVFSYM